ncbi:putative 4-hydroxybenzoyl-CoA reductase, alpha subunit [uncultured Desulfobacterium sp.]|uniref:Putative 4-hydroxybenzoyl-CoA reductase, alpha subunit n=1 Tax=uncultured Desulfobacterium sp. TaxID=201089 RepID=A0A445MYX1_9BACT|nr:putative 4-hydroxybenzoyl-CoA reductase, alpha subunit [uncultured Desulfobacterium sp.]
MSEETYSIIGKRLPFIDAVDKATGQAKYAANYILPGMLMGRLLRSPYPHAKVLNIDYSKALSLSGVKAVVTGADIEAIKGEKYGFFRSRRDETGLTTKARYIGDPVAAVAAVDEDTAIEALDLIKVEYEQLPAVFDPEEAMKDGAPVIHDEYQKNIVADRYFDFGDTDAGFKNSDYIREDSFYSQGISHGNSEPRACLAHYERSGKLTVWTSTQSPAYVQRDLSLLLKIPESKIRVIKPIVGCGFGGKVELDAHQVASAILSIKTGRPVKVVLTREEEIAATRIRVPMKVHVRTGVKKDGTLVAQDVKCLADGGAYASTSVLLMFNSGLTTLIPYRIPNLKYEGLMIYTNKPVGGAMRGHGANQPRFAIESQLDMIAEDLGMDAAEIRLRNATRAGDKSISGLVFDSCELSTAIKESTKSAQWEAKRGKKGVNRGIGLACGGFVCGARIGGLTATGSFIQVHDDGGVTVLTGSSDLGQGSRTIIAQVAAEELGLSLSDITVLSSDTEITPIDPGTFSSRVTFYAGNATLIAARDVKKQLANLAGDLLEANPDDIVFKERKVFVKGSPDKSIPFDQLANTLRTRGPGGLIMGKGHWAPTNTQFPDKKTRYGNVSGAYSFACQVAEVEVDTETGQVKVDKITIGDDCGQVINVLGAEGQAEGSAVMGMGQALTEDIIFGKNGQIMNPSYLDYRIPTAKDASDVVTLEVGKPDPVGPYGAKEIGEGLLISTVPAIANAIYDAVGVRITELPITPEKILKELDKKRGETRHDATA